MIRPATAQDIDDLIWAKDTASEGIGRILRRADHDETDAADAAWRRDTAAKITTQGEALSLPHWSVAEDAGTVGGALLAYEMAATPPITVETPPVIHPIFRLLSGVPGSLYIDSIATRPAARGRGLARALMQAAEARAKAAALPRLTLIALSSNSAARPLYFNLGFTDIAEEALIPSDWAPAARSAFLMEKSLA